jgi:glycosyltransferase involved in cell wall biosynthesis
VGYNQIKVPFFKSVLLRTIIVHPIVFWHCIRLKADAFHFHNPELIPLFLLLSILGKTIIFDVHENVSGQLSSRKKNSGPLLRRLYSFFKRQSINKFHFILAEDSYVEQYKMAKGEVEVVHNFPDTEKFPQVQREEKQSSRPSELFYIGGIGTQRGLVEMMHAAAELKSQIPDFKLHLVGPLYESPARLKSMQKFKEAEDVLVFHGTLPQDEALVLSKNAIAGLALLADSPNYRNSYPSKIFEYMAIGLPFIYTNFPLNVEVASGAGLGIPADDPKALVKAVLKLWNSPDLWKSLSEKGRELSQERYNWQREKEKLLAFYRRLGLSPVS